uniref:Uncharacterized protein n=1 Tax=Bursaphelenchus xylophilus TaxID=6326 RepID=A0A1I7SG62_BURXY
MPVDLLTVPQPVDPTQQKWFDGYMKALRQKTDISLGVETNHELAQRMRRTSSMPSVVDAMHTGPRLAQNATTLQVGAHHNTPKRDPEHDCERQEIVERSAATHRLSQMQAKVLERRRNEYTFIICTTNGCNASPEIAMASKKNPKYNALKYDGGFTETPYRKEKDQEQKTDNDSGNNTSAAFGDYVNLPLFSVLSYTVINNLL